MTAPTDPRRTLRIDAAFHAGDLEALRAVLGHPEDFPNNPMPEAIGPCLEYAIYHSPVAFIRQLLELGAEPNPTEHAGFPPLIATLSCMRDHPDAPARPDALEILALLLASGADPDQRGFNDYTALHSAVEAGSAEAVRLLLEAGADPRLRTRIDELETPGELAAARGRKEIEAILRAAERALG